MKTPSLKPAQERIITSPAKPLPVEQTLPVSPSRRAASPPKSSAVATVVKWVVFLGIAAALWQFSPYWWPYVSHLLGHAEQGPAARPVRPVPVVTATAQAETMEVYLDGLGTVTAFNTVTVKSRVEGELVNVAFKEGQMVQQGDLLAEIDPRPYIMQRDQARGKLVQDEAALKLGEVTLERQNDLMKANATTPQLVDQQVAMVDQAKALIQIDKAVYENTLLQLEYCRITAPISGRIGLRLVDRGNIVRANDPNGLMVITQLEPIALVFTIPQDEIPRVQQRMREQERLTVYAYDRDFKVKLATGELEAIDNQVDATTGTLRLKAMFDNKEHTLFPNQFVNARLLVDTLNNVIVVPSSAVQRGPENMYVYVVKPDETVELRTVIPGPTEGTRTCVTSGLAAGEVVVTDGLDKLQPGSKVVLREKGGPGGKPEGAKPNQPETPATPPAGGTGSPTHAPAKKSA